MIWSGGTGRAKLYGAGSKDEADRILPPRRVPSIIIVATKSEKQPRFAIC